jgi:ABC-type transporter lipoprotein component MlaA
MGADLAIDPVSWAVSGRMIDDIDWGRLGMEATDTAERWLDRARDIERTSLDPYVLYRSLYQQHRLYRIEQARADDRGLVCGTAD